ncbi:MAG: M55 family metallopeptidase [Clostridia bacterium]|nr:M55 family metallopeptidase [Clostridia bacterium]
MKKLFISADIEGTCGIARWKETDLEDSYFRTQMTKEVDSVCRAAKENGFDNVLIKDAHDYAVNLYPDKLTQTEGVEIIRNWTGDPYVMVSGIDETFTAAAFTGYHSPAFSSGSPLAHTMSTSLQFIKINGEFASEFMINAYSCAYKGVPTVLVTGDEHLCSLAKRLIPAITAVPVCFGTGGATRAPLPEIACGLIYNAAKEALLKDPLSCLPRLPERFTVDVQYKKQESANHYAFFPGAKLADPYTVRYECGDWYDALVFMLFCA